jgi:putative addiction module killer protein
MVEIRCWENRNGRKPVKEWLSQLKGVDEVAFRKVDRLLVLLRTLGREMGLPGARYLGGGLFELRDLGRGAGYRIYYTWVDEVIIILLAAGDKGSQDRDIDLARRRLADRTDTK